VIWDYTYYWGVLCQLFFQRRLTDLQALSRLRTELLRAKELNEAMQTFLREWSRHSSGRNSATLLDQASLDWFAELNRGLTDRLDDAGFDRRLRETTGQLDALARQIVARAEAECPELDRARVEAVLGETVAEAGPRPLLLFATAS
jgi:hypothetical protein